MANSTWLGYGSNFEFALSWWPFNTPEPGDTLTIAEGYADVRQGSTLDGLNINLGGPETVGANAPVDIMHVTTNTTQAFSELNQPSLEPTLSFESGSVIGASTTIQVPASGRSNANGATLWMHGNVVNNGTIGLPTNPSAEPQAMNLIFNDDSTGEFTNNGVINIPAVQVSNITGRPPSYQPIFQGHSIQDLRR